MDAAVVDRRLTNPVYWIMWLLPCSTVVAGLATLFIALRDADRPLPETYHWEGERLDADFARARAAADLGIAIEFEAGASGCRAVVRNLPRETAAINALLTNAADVNLDRRLRLQRVAPGEFRAACASIPTGHWRVAFDDDSASWALRASSTGNLAALTLGARDPDGVR